MKLGVPVNAILGANTGPTEAAPVKNGALFVWLNVTVWASGSVADAVTDTAAFSDPFTVASAVITGARFPVLITTDVVAVAVPAGTFTSTAVQLTVVVPV